jgi:O-antigen/teichoic acid export membrane protein
VRGPIAGVVESTEAKATRSVKWSALMELVSRSASPILFIVLARLLTPEVFGIFSVALIVTNFSQILWEAGLSRALVQTKEKPEDAANVVFWLNAALAIVTYGLIWVLAPAIAVFFSTPDAVPVLRVLGIQVLLLSLTATHQALFTRALDFRPLFWIKLLTAFVPAALAIPLALLGYGVWALVAGTLAASGLSLLLFWRAHPWRPGLHFDHGLARRMMVFGLWVTGEGLAGWFFLWGDNLLVGRYLGPESLGVYTVGWSVVAAVFGLALRPFLPVLYPTFSRMQDDPEALARTFARANRVVIAVALPIGVGLLITAPQLVPLLFGTKWSGLGFVVALIGFMHAGTWLVGINAEAYRAIGRPDVTTSIMFVSALLYLPVYLIAAPHGLEVFTYARVGVALLVGIPVHVYAIVRLLGFSPLYLWRQGRSMLLATLVMAAVITPLTRALPAEGALAALLTAALVGLGAAVYMVGLWIFDRDFMRQTSATLVRVAVSRG